MFQCLRFLLGMCCFGRQFCSASLWSVWTHSFMDVKGSEVPQTHLVICWKTVKWCRGCTVSCFLQAFTKWWGDEKKKKKSQMQNASENVWVLPLQCFPLTDVFWLKHKPRLIRNKKPFHYECLVCKAASKKRLAILTVIATLASRLRISQNIVTIFHSNCVKCTYIDGIVNKPKVLCSFKHVQL